MRLRIGLVLFVLAAFRAFAGTNIVPTTTLAAETGNNTSAAATFQAQTNGNIAPGNVSKVATNTLLYSGSTTTVYAHFMPWFGGTNHMNVGYDSTSPAQVKAQVTDMMSRSIAGVIIDWYGPATSRENTTSLAMKQEAESRNGAFHFAIMEDAGSISSCANNSGCDVTAALISDLQYIQQTYITSPAYITWNGNPVIFYFGVQSYNIDWTRVRANTTPGLVFVFENDNGFTASYSNAAFSWVMPSSVTSSDPMALSYMNDFYGTAQGHPSRLPVGAAYKGFNDSLASWGSNRLMQQQCGQTWLGTFNNANSWWSTTDQLALFQLVTWNDYEEATEIETGIDNCASVTASVSGSLLNWSITGNENTIDHYTIFISSDGQNLMSLGDFPAGTRAANLGGFGFNSGTYSVFVKAVGKPSIVNHMSAAAIYTVSNGPAVVLNVTPTSGIAPLPVTASTANSTDNQGTIVSSSIDFGDGTVISGTSASHTYANLGSYTITATLNDSVGLTASQSTTVTVTTPQPPVARLSVTPGSGTAPVTVTASTSASTDPQGSALTSTINFGDGTTTAGPSATHTYGSTGTYTVTATLSDALSMSSQATATVTVNAGASITVSQPANNTSVHGPIHVVASGTAPSGVDALQIYLDNTLVYQANASSFDTTVATMPGPHFIVVQLWDKLGNYYKYPLNVTVIPALVTSMSVSSSTIATGNPVTATISANSGTISSSSINWGDGSTSAGLSASHVYNAPGTYTITGTASDATSSVQNTANVTVIPPLVTSMSLSASTISAGSGVTASISASSGTISSSSINWGDGSTSAGPSASHVYNAPGTYTITSTASDSVGDRVQNTSPVSVSDPMATVVLQTPTQGANVPLSLEIKGYASSPIGISSIQISIDSKVVYQGNTTSVDAYFKSKSGSHQITLQAQDTAGFIYQSSVTVNVSSNALNSMKGN